MVLRRLGIGFTAVALMAGLVGWSGPAGGSAHAASVSGPARNAGPTGFGGRMDLEVSCTSASCNGEIARATLELAQSGSTITGTASATGGGALGTAMSGPVTGTVRGESAELAIGDQLAELQLLVSSDGTEVRGMWDASGIAGTGASGALAGVRLPATGPVTTPDWGGHWSGVSTCTASVCAGQTTSGTLDLDQKGTAITGTGTDAATGEVRQVTGTASGSNATLSAGEGSVSGTYHLAMADDGKSFTGTVEIAGTSGGSQDFGTIAGTRDGVAALAVAVAVDVPRAGLGIRRTGKVTVQVTAVGGEVDGISLGDGLVPSTAGVTVTSTPSGLSGFSLQQGASQSFTFGINGVKAGPVTLSATATGTDKAGDDVTGSGSAEVKVGGAQIVMTVSSSPESLTIRKGVSGQARTVTVRVRMRNAGDEPADDVQLLSLVPTPVDHTQALKPLRFSQTFPHPVGTIAPGDTRTETFTLDATGGFGAYEIEALAMFADPTAEGGNGRAFATGPVFDVVTSEATKLLEFTYAGTKHTLYYDPATGAVLGKLPLRDPLTHADEVFFYDAVTGALDLRNPTTGERSAITYDPSSKTVTLANPGAGEAGVLHLDPRSHELQIVGPDGAAIASVLYDQKQGTFRASVPGP